MVIHDSDLRRLANLDARVWNLTLAQIEQADIGSNVGPQFAGERIPTLDQFLGVAKGQIKLNVQLKYDRDAPLLAGKVVNQVRAKGMQNERVSSSVMTASRCSHTEAITTGYWSSAWRWLRACWRISRGRCRLGFINV